MSGAVDVLSRLSNWATCEALLGGNFDKAHAIDDVRAAVAELIEAANAIAAHQDAATSSEWDRMNAALALVQGSTP